MFKKHVLGAFALLLALSGFSVPTIGAHAETPTYTASVVTSTSGADITPRINYWWGKVNQHMSTTSGTWETDPDGVSGASLDKLTYCKKWYPETVMVRDYKLETITDWRNAGNTGSYTGTFMSTECVQPQPDLVVEDLIYTVVKDDGPYDHLQFSIMYTNNGPGDADNFYISIETESTDEYPNGYVVDMLASSVEARETKTMQVQGGYSFPDGTPLNFTATAKVDLTSASSTAVLNNLVAEWNEDNNTRTETVTVEGTSATAPLQVYDITVLDLRSTSAWVEWKTNSNVIFSVAADTTDFTSLPSNQVLGSLYNRSGDVYTYRAKIDGLNPETLYYYKIFNPGVSSAARQWYVADFDYLRRFATESAVRDDTNRISYWWGKVNQHFDHDPHFWMTDPDGVSGANLDKLTYCKKWYPETVSVREYRYETIVDWKERGNVNSHVGTFMSYECVAEDSSSTTPTPDLVVSDIRILPESEDLQNRNQIVVTVENVGDSEANVLNSFVTVIAGTNIDEINRCNVGACRGVGDMYNAGIYIGAYGNHVLTPGEKYDLLFSKASFLLDEIEFENGSLYAVKAIVDDGSTVDESNENNNTKVVIVGNEAEERDPDLIVKGVSFYPSNPIQGKKFTGELRVKISNIGDEAVQVTPGTCPYEVSVRMNSATPIMAWPDNTDFANRGMISCGPTISGDQEVVFGLTEAVFNSDVSLLATVDSGNDIAESNEYNNSFNTTVALREVADGETVVTISDARVAEVGTQTALVKWETNILASGVVFYGTNEADVVAASLTNLSALQVQHVPELEHHSIVVKNLAPDTVYYFKVYSDVSLNNYDESAVLKAQTRPRGSEETVSVGDTDSSDQNADDSTGDSEEVIKLKERIKNLERHVSELEHALVEQEKTLTKNINTALVNRLKGKILLQVEGNGEAWYIDPLTGKRYYLKDGETAYSALQVFGLGITNQDLEKIPVGIEDRADMVDSDGDGLDDQLEEALGSDPNNPDTDGDGHPDGVEVRSGYNPNGDGRLLADNTLADRLEGKIVIQVEGNGEAWYVQDGKRYYMKNGPMAYQIMRYLSLGVTNDDIRQIGVGDLE